MAVLPQLLLQQLVLAVAAAQAMAGVTVEIVRYAHQTVLVEAAGALEVILAQAVTQVVQVQQAPVLAAEVVVVVA